MEHDLTTEDIVTLHDACDLFPRRSGGTPVHVSRLYRYTKYGCRGIILESLQCGATRCTTRQAVARFFHRLSEARDLPRPTSDVDRDAAIASGKRLRSMRKPKGVPLNVSHGGKHGKA